MAKTQPLSASVVELLVLVYKILAVYLRFFINLFRKTPRKSIKGQNVLITGSGHGLGREMALKFAQAGGNLILIDINEENNDKVKEDILKLHEKDNIKVFTHSTDIGDESKVAKLLKKAQNELGDIDILVNNAGVVQCKPFSELDVDMIEKTFRVNTLAHFWTIKHFLPSMIKNKRGHIVAISSIAGVIGNKYISDYCASKFAINGLMEALDKEIHDGGANENVHLTTVCPCSMSTGMFQTFTSKFEWLLPVLKADQVADRVIDAILTNKSFIAVPSITLFFHRLSSFVPQEANYLVQDYLNYGVKPHAA